MQADGYRKATLHVHQPGCDLRPFSLEAQSRSEIRTKPKHAMIAGGACLGAFEDCFRETFKISHRRKMTNIY
jgi:hypothetical protein